MKLAGILLIILGVAALIYGGVSFTTQKKAVDLGPLQVNKTEHHSVPLPPILGVVAILGGGLLAYYGAKKRI
jgi:drug/metabolite transporter (DMT)-like permease